MQLLGLHVPEGTVRSRLTRHLLKNGTLKYIFELENGAGYVVNYSLNMEMIYYLRYIDDINCFEKTMEGNEQELVLE